MFFIDFGVKVRWEEREKEGGKGRGGEREREIDQLPPICVPARNRTRNLSAYRWLQTESPGQG